LNREIFSSSCLRGGCCSAPLPPSFPLVTIGRMHGKRRTGRDGVVLRDSGRTSPWFSRPRERRLGLAECSGARPRRSTLLGPRATSSGRNGATNVRPPRFGGQPRLFGRRLCLLAKTAAGRS
jgi:hypothetical protein